MSQENNFDSQTCPYLGIYDDPETQFLYATSRHTCYRVDLPDRVSITHQDEACLTPDFQKCPVYPTEWQGPLPEDILGERYSKPRRQYLLLPIIILVIIVGWLIVGGFGDSLMGYFGLTEFISTQASEQSIIPTNTLKASVRVVTATQSPPTETQSLDTPTNTPTTHATWTQQPTMTFTPPATPGPGLGTPFGAEEIYVVHRVQEGQSLIYLSTLYNTSPDAIEKANVFREGRTVWPGDIIIIPVGQDDPQLVPSFYYRFVEKKTNISEIAAEYDANENDLKQYNALGDSEWVPVGRWLIIPIVGQ